MFTLKVCHNCLIAVYNPIGVNFLAFTQMALTGAPFIRMTCNLVTSSKWVALQELPQLSDTHFSQILNKLEKIFFHGFIKYHVPLYFI